ncbi:MAG: glycosyltransferase [Chloroflexi bacterium]|nr:glycosyltransferase [Chloroflexota bacterium]
MSEKYQIIVYIVQEWDTFHRRPMLEALARNARGQAHLLLVAPLLSPLGLLGWRGGPRVRRKPGLRRLSENVALLTPVVWLLGTGRLPWLRRLPQRALASQVRHALRQIGPPDAQRVEWVFRPEQAPLVGLAPGALLVYECYDEYTRSPVDGAPVPRLVEQEDILLRKAGLVLTTSEHLYRSRSARHPRVVYTPNGVDYGLFAQARESTLAIAEELHRIPSPRIGFVGNVSETSIDYPLLEDLARRHSEWSLVLVGPANEVSLKTRRRLGSLPNVHFTGWIERARLPSFLKGFDVALIPFSTGPWNLARNPLKLWEYLAAGKPVVATRIPEIEKYADAVYLTSTPAEFEAAVRTAIERHTPGRAERGAELAREHSWERLTARVLAQALAAASDSVAPGVSP